MPAVQNPGVQASCWRCPTCGKPVAGTVNGRNRIRVECLGCGTVMIRTICSRRHATMEIYVP